MLTRRQMLTLSATGLLLPVRLAHAAAPSRRFLFVNCYGGWDQTWAFAPVFGSETVDMPSDSEKAESAGIPHVNCAATPNVHDFFEAHGDITCLVNGLQIPSVAHAACQRLLYTGQTREGRDDWPATLAASDPDALMPLGLLEGPSFTNRFGGSVVRFGGSGQLLDLIDGSAIASPPSAEAERAVAAYQRQRAEAALAAAAPGQHARLANQVVETQARAELLSELSAELDLSGGSLAQDLSTAVELLAQGHARVVMMSYDSWNDVFNGWDTHTELDLQGPHFDELFGSLTTLLDEMRSTPGSDGGSLADEVTIVVASEMGRFPLINDGGGKDHWAWTSAMLIGSGVAGGQAVGEYDENCAGLQVDFSSGAADDGGRPILGSDFGATLLALGDVDPGEFVPEGEIIAACLA